jgi:hypothetical protein
MHSEDVRGEEAVDNLLRHTTLAPFQIVTGAFDFEQLGLGWDERKRRTHLSDRSEGIFGPVDEQTTQVQIREMCRSELGRLTWRVERVGKQQQPGRYALILRSEDGGLAATVRKTAQKDFRGTDLMQLFRCGL